jgi:myo-inositol-1(or 4)-monophosphatase
MDLLQFATQIAVEAGDLLKSEHHKPRDIRHKGDIDLVTEMDLKAEALIIKAIQASFPGHSILAEESGDTHAHASSEYLWVIDPLDGTTNYAHGLPIYCVSVGLLKDNKPYLGVIYAPELGELYTAQIGQGAKLNGKSLTVSQTTDLASSLLVTGFPYDVQTQKTNLADFEKFTLQVRAVRRLGSAAIDLAWVAAGRFDGFWEAKLSPWDVFAGHVILTEAGGQITDYQGQELGLNLKPILASNGHIHISMMNLLNN